MRKASNMFCVSLLPEPSVASPSHTPFLSMAPNGLVCGPPPSRPGKAIRQDADLVEMTDRADTEKTLALQKLAFRLADVHMHHGIEVDRRLLAAPELLLSTAVRSRGTDDRQDQV